MHISKQHLQIRRELYLGVIITKNYEVNKLFYIKVTRVMSH